MRFVSQLGQLLRTKFLMNREMLAMVVVVQAAMAAGMVLGFGYFVPHIGPVQAMFITAGAATQVVITVGLVMLPQTMSQEKAEGMIDYFLTLPISREAYLLAEIAFVAIVTLPGVAFAVVLGAWHYGIDMPGDPRVIAVALLAILSLTGVGVAMVVLVPHPQLVNIATQLIIFWVLLFSPVMMPREQLPAALRSASVVLPTTYAADAMRATLTDLPGTNFGRAMLVLAGYCVVSLGVSAVAIRRRG